MVEGYLDEFTALAMSAVKDSMPAGMSVSALTIRQIATAIFGRPNVDPGGASEFEILDPLMNTDTKSYEDLSKIAHHLSSRSPAGTEVEICIGDGQTCIAWKNLKVKYPHLYARWVIAVGGFHEHAHFMFAITEAFWYCLLFTLFVTVLQLEQVREVTRNLEHNAYAHHQLAHHVVTIGITCYLLQDVISPPPQLLLDDFDQYTSQVNCGGGIVLLKYLRYGGFPIRTWQFAARCGEGALVRKLFAFGFHVCRSVAHKPVCVQILLIGLLGFECTHPEISRVLQACVSMSLLGRCGANIYVDRLLEYINQIQQGSKRSAHAASFGRALDLTTLLRAMIHVRHAFQDAERNGSAGHDSPITQSMLIQARLVQDFLLETLGRDLTVYDDNNPFWYTGNPVPYNTGDYRTRMPWELIKRVQQARSAGKGRSRHEPWDDFALRFVLEHFFKF